MNPVRTSFCNSTLLAPKGHPDCGDLPILRDETSVWSFWIPEPPELAALNRGGTVALRIQGTTHPPLSIMAANPDQPETSSPSPTGIQLIAIERDRQIHHLGWTHEHDDSHNDAELAKAAACYASVGAAVGRGLDIEQIRDLYTEGMEFLIEWPWKDDSWKPSNDPIPNLIKAGALIAAEIDRLQRLTPPA